MYVERGYLTIIINQVRGFVEESLDKILRQNSCYVPYEWKNEEKNFFSECRERRSACMKYEVLFTSLTAKSIQIILSLHLTQTLFYRVIDLLYY